MHSNTPSAAFMSILSDPRLWSGFLMSVKSLFVCRVLPSGEFSSFICIYKPFLVQFCFSFLGESLVTLLKDKPTVCLTHKFLWTLSDEHSSAAIACANRPRNTSTSQLHCLDSCTVWRGWASCKSATWCTKSAADWQTRPSFCLHRDNMQFAI